jgi:hypothetical protein
VARLIHAVLIPVLLASLAAACAGQCIINEVMYHPASHEASDEWIELLNADPSRPLALRGWRLEGGVSFQFTDETLAPGGFLVIAADPARVKASHSGAFPVAGPFSGRLSNSDDPLVLLDQSGREIDRIHYAQDGEWAPRVRGPEDYGHRGLVWDAPHDGGGSSLELIQPLLPNQTGQNWAASATPAGTPGRPNSVFSADIAPLIMETALSPVIPRSTDSVTVRARVVDGAGVVTVRLHHRIDGSPEFEIEPMHDDGVHADDSAGDGIYGAILPPRPTLTVVEVFIEAEDAGGRVRTFPAPVQEDGVPRQIANLLYQVDEEPVTSLPCYRLVLTAADRAELHQINRGLPPAPFVTFDQTRSHAQFNATLIAAAHGDVDVRYNVGLRNRGNGSRLASPQSFRINLPSDRRWEGITGLNLNSQQADLQILGSILFRHAGVAAARSAPATVRVNGVNPAQTAAQHGFYAANEVIDSDFASHQFPRDDGGNIYRAQRQDRPLLHANLQYLGPDPDVYRTIYSKQSNRAEDDWTDLIELSRILTETHDSNYLADVRRVIDLPQWIRYFALNTILDNRETSPVNGHGDDYFLLQGGQDPRFRLIPYDLDTILGAGRPSGNTNDPLFMMLNGSVPNFVRLLTHPEVAPLFLGELRDLAANRLAPSRFEPLLDHVLGPITTPERRALMKQFHTARCALVLSRIPERLTATVDAPLVDGIFTAADPMVGVGGVADPVHVRQVLVNGVPGEWIPWRAQWTNAAVALRPGVNRLLVQAMDATGAERERLHLDVVWPGGGPLMSIGGALGPETVWDLGPYLLTGQVVVPQGALLRIEPGVTVYAEPGAELIVHGTLVADGAATARIRFTRSPGGPDLTNSWAGLAFESALGTNVLSYTDLEFAGARGESIAVTGSTLLLEGCTFAGTTRTLIETRRSSMLVRDCVFPDIAEDELIHGAEIAEFLRIERNVFGTTTGYNDIIDFSRARRPGPILEVWSNLFTGGTDDVLDLDGCDAHVEGNLFLNVTNGDPTAPGTSSAISFGEDDDYGPHVVAARNWFFNVDHVVLCKEGGYITLEHNTAIRVGIAAVNFSEPLRGVRPGRGARLEGNIIWNCPLNFENRTPGNGTVEVRADRNVFSAPDLDAIGTGNLRIDPLLVGTNVTTPDDIPRLLRLAAGSPLKGTGRAGLDPGAAIHPGVAIGGIPPGSTWQTRLTAVVYGPGITGYRWRLDGGPWSDALSIDQTLVLTDLPAGPHRIEAIGRDSAGHWSLPEQASSLEWTVDPAASRLRLSELLVLPNPGEEGFVEVCNDGPEPLDPAEWCIELEGDVLSRRVLPGAVIAPGARVAMQFKADPRGGTLILRRGAQSLETLTFGAQLRGASIALTAFRGWSLAEPSPGQANRPAALGNPEALRINEWMAAGRFIYPDDFIELFNPQPYAVSLDGLALTDNPIGVPRKAPFAPLNFVAPYSTAVWIANDSLAPGHLPFRLRSEEGAVALMTDQAEVIDAVYYGRQARDLSEGRTPNGSPAFAFFDQPTPGILNPAASGVGGLIAINEVLVIPALTSDTDAGPAVPRVAYLELFNPGDHDRDLAGMTLSDDLADPGRFTFPQGTVVTAHGYIAVALSPETPSGFAIAANLVPNPAGAAFLLFESTTGGPALVDSVRFGPQCAGYSIGRVTPGTGPWALGIPTPQTANRVAPADLPDNVRLNEWMAAPNTGTDWLELFNRGKFPADLSGLQLSDDPAEPGRFLFPILSFIGSDADAFLLLEARDPAWMPGRTGFGLAREGERIALRFPSGAVIDEVAFGPQTAEVSQGRWPDGGEAIRPFAGSPTPGGPNRLVTLEDRDGDGLPDAWETRHGLRPDLAVGDEAAGGDPDRDGMSNRAEFLAGTHPRDGASVLAIALQSTNGTLEISFHQPAGRRCEVQSSPLLDEAFWETLVVREPAADAVIVRETIGPVPDHARFFRLVVSE